MNFKKIQYKWVLVILLWFAFFLHQAARQIYNTVIPLIKDSLGFSNVQLGLVTTIFTLVYGILVPFSGYAGDVLRRKWIVFFSLLIFSLGTMFTGISSTLFMLILFRSVVSGGGEAFYYPASNSLLGQFHYKSRAMAMSIHQTALYVGIIASGFIAGYIGENYGWRFSFYVFGGAGLLWAVLVAYRLKDSAKNATTQFADSGKNHKDNGPSKESVQKIPVKEVVYNIFKKRSVWMLCLAFSTMVFVQQGYLTWMPTFLYEDFSLSLSKAGFNAMFYHFILAFFGVLVGGRLSDKWAMKHRKTRIITEYVGLLMGVPFIFLMGYTNNLVVCYASLGLFGFFRGIYDSNLFAALYDVVDPKYRSSATGVMLAFGFIVGALAPVFLGWVKTAFSLANGISFLSVFHLIGGILLITAAKFYYHKDFVVETRENDE